LRKFVAGPNAVRLARFWLIVEGGADGAQGAGVQLHIEIFAAALFDRETPARAARCAGKKAMGSVNHIDLKSTPKAIADWTPMLASNTAHLARLLKESAYPGTS
jgi:hypothetical protein